MKEQVEAIKLKLKKDIKDLENDYNKFDSISYIEFSRGVYNIYFDSMQDLFKIYNSYILDKTHGTIKNDEKEKEYHDLRIELKLYCDKITNNFK